MTAPTDALDLDGLEREHRLITYWQRRAEQAEREAAIARRELDEWVQEAARRANERDALRKELSIIERALPPPEHRTEYAHGEAAVVKRLRAAVEDTAYDATRSRGKGEG